MKDYHVHSNFSDDCFKQTLPEACTTALRVGITEICFTEHVDMNYPVDKGDFQLDYETYSKEIEKARSSFPQLTILKGLEFGMQEGISEQMHSYLNNHTFDFILGSIHAIDGLELFGGKFSAGKTEDEAYARYFETMLACVKNFEKINVLAHFNLLKRYIYVNSSEYEIYTKHFDVIDEIFNVIIEKGIGLEINTSGWRYGVNSTIPGLELLKRYKLKGGEIITFGSDAHRPEHLGYKFKEAYSLARESGFKYYAYYRKGKPQFAIIP